MRASSEYQCALDFGVQRPGTTSAPQTVTLENPHSIEAALVSVLELASPRTSLAIVDGVTEASVGLLAYPSFTFTPAEAGPVGLTFYAANFSRGEPMRFSVTQE